MVKTPRGPESMVIKKKIATYRGPEPLILKKH